MPVSSYISKGYIIFKPGTTKDKISQLQDELMDYFITFDLGLLEKELLNEKFLIAEYFSTTEERGLYWLTELISEGKSEISDIFKDYGAYASYIGTLVDYYSTGDQMYESPELVYITNPDKLDNNDLKAIQQYIPKWDEELDNNIDIGDYEEEYEFFYYILLNEKINTENEEVKAAIEETVKKYEDEGFSFNISIEAHPKLLNVLALKVTIECDLEEIEELIETGEEVVGVDDIEYMMTEAVPEDMCDQLSFVEEAYYYDNSNKKKMDSLLFKDNRVIK